MPVRPALPPGAVVLRRDARHLQVGTTPGVVVPDRPGLLVVLRLMDGARDVAQLTRLARPVAPDLAEDLPSVVGRMLAVGALVDGAATPTRPRLDVTVRSSPAAQDLATAVRTVVDSLDLAPSGPEGPGLVVIVTETEPARSLVEPCSRAGLPHLLVRADGARVRVGPLVVPGLSPCLTCQDLARSEQDPGWRALLPQLEERHLTIGSPAREPVTRWAAAASVGADVSDLASGRRPRAVGAVLVHEPGEHRPRLERLTFHHRCGCWLLSTG